jgi:hypothetical protein
MEVIIAFAAAFMWWGTIALFRSEKHNWWQIILGLLYYPLFAWFLYVVCKFYHFPPSWLGSFEP